MESIIVDSWSELLNVPMAVLVAGLVVQFSKSFINGSSRLWQQMSAAVAVIFMLIVTIASNPDIFLLALFLSVINGMIAGVAASKAYEVGHDVYDVIHDAVSQD